MIDCVERMTQVAKFSGGNRHRRPMPGSAAFNKRNAWIFVGTVNGVRRARSKPGSLIAPLDLDPASVIWPVAGVEGVMLITSDAQRAYAERLGICLIADGAKLVVTLSTDSGEIISWKKSQEAISEQFSRLDRGGS